MFSALKNLMNIIKVHLINTISKICKKIYIFELKI